MCILLLWVLLRREPNLVALRSAYFKLKIQKIHALRSWPRSLMFALHQSLAIPSPAVILRTMYLLMTLKSKSLADIFFFLFPNLFSNLVDILTWMSSRPLKLSKIKTKLLPFSIESVLTLLFLFQWMDHHPLCCEERNLGITFDS